MVDEIEDELRDRGLLPQARSFDAAALGLGGSVATDVVDRARGALVGGAIGDALGRPGETRSRGQNEARFGTLTDFLPWPGWVSGPIGTITDDTQLTVLVAECIVAGDGRVDPGDLADRLIEWLPVGRGVGSATRQSVERLIEGYPWFEAGVPSAGNGAAMRVGPVGLRHREDPTSLMHDAALSAIPTHAHPMAVASSIAQAFATALATHSTGQIDGGQLIESTLLALEGIDDPGEPERRHGAGSAPVSLATRIAELPDMLELEPGDAFDRLYTGAFVLESLPSAWWCVLRDSDDPEAALITAANCGHDTDTVAAMAGTILGALHGMTAWPERWLDELEYRDELVGLADALVAPT